MSKHEGRSDDHTVSAVTQPHPFDDDPGILTIRPVPGHPFVSLSLYEQEYAPEPGPSTAEVAATWANLHDLAHEWGSLASSLASLTGPASAHLFQAIGMVFLALSHEESAYAHYFLVGNRLRYPPSTIAEGLERAGIDLHEAFVNWTAVGMWVERLANERRATPALLDTIRPFVMRARAHQHRLWSLLLSVQQEHARLSKQDAAHKGGQA